jgi:hypothetical protein
MKKLISLIAAVGILFGCTSMPKNISSQKPEDHKLYTNQEKIFSNLEIPIEFADYTKKVIAFSEEIQPYDERPIHVVGYNLDGDKISDVIEVRRFIDLANFEPEKNPFMVIFMKRNAEHEETYIIFDEYKDGWNGNEVLGNKSRYAKI